MVAQNKEQGSYPCPWWLPVVPADYDQSHQQGGSVGCRGKLQWQGDVDLGLNEEGCSPDKSLPGGASLVSGKSGGGMNQVLGGQL
jgi:hypothetical protein